MNPWRGLKNLPRGIWILCAATLVNRAGTMVLPFLVLYLTHILGIPPARAALALTVYGLAALLTSPIAGRLTDRVGPLAVMKGSLFLSGLVLFLFPLAHSFAAILAITLVFAILNESVRPPSLSIISDLVAPPQRKAAFALSRLAINLGMSIGPALGGILAVFSFHWLFFVDGATSILAGVVLALAPWPQKGHLEPYAPEKEDPSDLGREIEADGVELLPPAHPVADLRAFRNRHMLYFLAALIPAQLIFFQLTSTVPLFLVHNLRLPESLYGSVFTLNTLLMVAIEVPLNTAMAHWPHRQALSLGAFLYAVGFSAFGLVTSPAGILATTVVWTFGEMILLPASAAYVAEIAPPSRRGEYMGLYTMSFSISFALAGLLGASLLQRWGPHALWGATFASGCFAALLMSRIGAPRRNPPGESALLQ